MQDDAEVANQFHLLLVVGANPTKADYYCDR